MGDEGSAMGAGEALVHAVDRIIEPVQAIHQQVAHKWLRRTDPLSRPVRFGHNAVSGLVYGALELHHRAGAIDPAQIADMAVASLASTA